MAPQFDRRLRELLRAAGCKLVRQGKGSHEIWQSPITKRNFAVPVGIASRHTANAILLRQACPNHSDEAARTKKGAGRESRRPWSERLGGLASELASSAVCGCSAPATAFGIATAATLFTVRSRTKVLHDRPTGRATSWTPGRSYLRGAAPHRTLIELLDQRNAIIRI